MSGKRRGSRTLPDENNETEPALDLESRSYFAAARDLVGESDWTARWPGTEYSDLARDLQHESYSAQDFSSLRGTDALGPGVAEVQNTTDNLQRGDVDKGFQPWTERDQDQYRDKEILEDNSDIHNQGHEVDEQLATPDAREVALKVQGLETYRARNETHTRTSLNGDDGRPTHSEILKQQERILQISQNSALNLAKVQALIAQLSARIDQLSVQQHQLQGNWRRLRMEDQNRTQQNLGGN